MCLILQSTFSRSFLLLCFSPESNVDLAPPTHMSAPTTTTGHVTAAAQRDGDTGRHYENVEDVMSASHDPQYYDTEGSSTGHYDQLTVQYENTGDVRPYQQWSVSREGQHGSDTRTAWILDTAVEDMKSSKSLTVYNCLSLEHEIVSVWQ